MLNEPHFEFSDIIKIFKINEKDHTIEYDRKNLFYIIYLLDKLNFYFIAI